MTASNDSLDLSPYVREGLALAHRIAKEAYWIRELAQRLCDSSTGEIERQSAAETIAKVAGRVFTATRDFRSEIERSRTAERGVSFCTILRQANAAVVDRLGLHPIESALTPAAEAIRIDPSLGEVVVILLENAVEASADESPVRITADAIDATLELEIVDCGVGMPATLADRCFEPGFTTKADSGGKGLGLTIARAAVNAAGGTIELHSGSTGTRIVVRVPGV